MMRKTSVGPRHRVNRVRNTSLWNSLWAIPFTAAHVAVRAADRDLGLSTAREMERATRKKVAKKCHFLQWPDTVSLAGKLAAAKSSAKIAPTNSVPEHGGNMAHVSLETADETRVKAFSHIDGTR